MAQVMDDFPAVYRTHHGFVWHALHRFGLASSLLEDAVQDVFIVAYRWRDRFRGASLKAWLYGIARRVASNYRRAGQRHQRRSEAYSASVPAPRQPLPEAIVALDTFLQRLPHEDRELFVLSEVEGLSGPEIAAVRGRNVHTVYTQIRRLRRGLGAELPDPQRVRREQPRASAGSWGLLLPWLGEAPLGASTVTATATSVGVKWGLGLVLASAVAATVGVSVGGSTREAMRPGSAATGSAATPPVSTAPPTSAAPDPAAAAVDIATAGDVVHPVAPRAAQPRPSTRPVAAPPAAVDPVDAPGLSEENTMLGKASAALREGRASDALRWTTEHHQRFPKSGLGDLRAAVRIEALCLAGKGQQAKAEAKRLIAQRPGSAAARRVGHAIEKNCEAPQQKPPTPDTTTP